MAQNDKPLSWRRSISPFAQGLLWGFLSWAGSLALLIGLTAARGKFGNLTGLMEFFVAVPIGLVAGAIGMSRGAARLPVGSRSVWHILAGTQVALALLGAWTFRIAFQALFFPAALNNHQYHLPPPSDAAQAAAARRIQEIKGGYKLGPGSGGQSIVEINLGQDPATDEDLQLLASLPDVRKITLNMTRITDDGLAHLKGWKKLENLDIMAVRVRGPGLAHLTGLPRLRDLALGASMVNDDAMAYVGKMATLRRLSLFNTRLTDRGIEPLRALKELRHLDLNGTRVTDGALTYIGELKNLRSLWLRGTRVTDVGIEAFHKKLPQVKIVAEQQ